jgi:hypothetical protein
MLLICVFRIDDRNRIAIVRIGIAKPSGRTTLRASGPARHEFEALPCPTPRDFVPQAPAPPPVARGSAVSRLRFKLLVV